MKHIHNLTVLLLLLTACASPLPTPSRGASPTPSPTLESTSTLVPSPTIQSTKTVLPTPTKTVTPIPDGWSVLFEPFLIEAQQRRSARAEGDPDYAKRIDLALNQNRVNFLLFCYGETYEPPAAAQAIIGSDTVASMDFKQKKIQLISLTHDIRAPEVERVLWPGQKKFSVRIDQAFFVGKHELNRRVIEDATGLAIDYQLVCRDSAIKRLVDEVFGGIEVEIKTPFKVQPFYLDNERFPEGSFSAGKQRLNGKQVIQFIKTVPVSDGYYGKDLEHNERKAVILQALVAETKRQVQSKEFWAKASWFFGRETVTGGISLENPWVLLVRTFETGKRMVESGQKIDGLPEIDSALYIVDPCCGAGGVRWVNGDPYPLTQADISQGVYPDKGESTQIPFDANPYGDLATEYWGSVRTLVRQFLAR